MLEHVIRADGYEVVACSGGAQALNAALTSEFDLLVTDIMLPDISGLELVRAIKSQTPNLPVIVVSAMDPTRSEAAALAAGATRFLSKPIRLSELRSELAMANASRMGLRVVIMDQDVTQARRLARELSQHGCDVQVVTELAEPQASLTSLVLPNLVLLDARLDGVLELVAWTRSQKVTAFIIMGDVNPKAEEALMRAGAALILSRPVNSDHLLTQARFLALA